MQTETRDSTAARQARQLPYPTAFSACDSALVGPDALKDRVMGAITAGSFRLDGYAVVARTHSPELQAAVSALMDRAARETVTLPRHLSITTRCSDWRERLHTAFSGISEQFGPALPADIETLADALSQVSRGQLRVVLEYTAAGEQSDAALWHLDYNDGSLEDFDPQAALVRLFVAYSGAGTLFARQTGQEDARVMWDELESALQQTVVEQFAGDRLAVLGPQLERIGSVEVRLEQAREGDISLIRGIALDDDPLLGGFHAAPIWSQPRLRLIMTAEDR